MKHLNITFRRDPTNFRPRINKLESTKDREQKSAGSYYYLDDWPFFFMNMLPAQNKLASCLCTSPLIKFLIMTMVYNLFVMLFHTSDQWYCLLYDFIISFLNLWFKKSMNNLTEVMVFLDLFWCYWCTCFFWFASSEITTTICQTFLINKSPRFVVMYKVANHLKAFKEVNKS